MGKRAKGSRKGKKAWRANISTEDIEDFFEKSTKDVLSGGSLSQLPNESLFYVDQSKDLSVKRKIEKQREKVLRCDSVLQKNPFVQTVPSSKSKLKKSKKKNKDVEKVKDASEDGSKGDGATPFGIVDIWANEGEGDKPKKVSKPSVIPAVEVEAPGCSYNPSFESHQESLAQAVAEEMQKVYQTELGPEPVPITVPGKVIDDADRYFLEVDNGSDDENAENLSENEDNGKENRSTKTKRVTRVELNKRARHKELEKKEAEAKKMEGVSKQIDSLPNIIEEITKEDEEKHNRHIRRVVAKQERLKVRPPRLGKHKFEPAPTQVLLSEEITGSLRKLKGCPTLVNDRFKSLEKRGLIVPIKSKRK
ncbi:Ribosome biogenesis protein NOP53 [Melia azedarach]|uniref:Ribosome biogenesis protein NOP53 n=1 Tax=Melia azedarach TaxID=155640 RepID=A0ACC1Y9U2_MELAZ|nr:Ribosome biogenesis protein NOP53 [Melia azedarach]